MENSFINSILNNNNEYYHSIVGCHNKEVDNINTLNKSSIAEEDFISEQSNINEFNDFLWIETQQAILTAECELRLLEVELARQKMKASEFSPGPIVKNGILVGYIVKRGQGFTQIADDINSPITQKKYGYKLKRNIKWYELSEHPFNLQFTKNANIKNNPNYKLRLQGEIKNVYQPNIRNKYDKGYWTNPSLKEGDILYIDRNIVIQQEDEAEVWRKKYKPSLVGWNDGKNLYSETLKWARLIASGAKPSDGRKWNTSDIYKDVKSLNEWQKFWRGAFNGTTMDERVFKNGVTITLGYPDLYGEYGSNYITDVVAFPTERQIKFIGVTNGNRCQNCGVISIYFPNQKLYDEWYNFIFNN